MGNQPFQIVAMVAMTFSPVVCVLHLAMKDGPGLGCASMYPSAHAPRIRTVISAHPRQRKGFSLDADRNAFTMPTTNIKAANAIPQMLTWARRKRLIAKGSSGRDGREIAAAA